MRHVQMNLVWKLFRATELRPLKIAAMVLRLASYDATPKGYSAMNSLSCCWNQCITAALI
jgi:hypothetical protein